METLLFLTPELPYPPRSGGKLKSLRLLDALAERYQVTLVSPLKGEDCAYRAEFDERSPCRTHVHRRVNVDRSASALLRSYLNGVPLNVHRSFDRALADQVRRLAPLHDIVFLDHYEMGAYLPDSYRGSVIYHAHNAYHQLWNRYAQLPGNPLLRAASYLEAIRVRREECRVAQRADLVFAAPNDAAFLVGAGVDASRISHTYHLGDDSQLELPALDFHSSERRIMYVGFLGWEANRSGLLWFIENVWPRLLQCHPDLKFDIVGKGPDERLQAHAQCYPGIRLHGFVEDLQPIYRKARVSVAPLLFGSGMKVKVLDAMARGLPTVTTPVGAEGIDCINGEHLAVAESAEDMANAVIRLLEDDTSWFRMMNQSRRLVRERYTWKALFQHMHAAIDTAIKTTPLGQAGTRSAL